MEQHQLVRRFEELSRKVNNCKTFIFNGASYTTIEQVEEWSNNMRECAIELNSLFSDSLRHLSTKLI